MEHAVSRPRAARAQLYRDAGAEVVGANCGTEMSLADYERLTAELVAAAAGCPVIALSTS